MNNYNQNTLVRCAVAFTAASDGSAADPTAVTVTVTDPNGASTSPTAVKDGVGLYHADVIPTVQGIWTYGFRGTGAVVAYGEGQFFAEPSNA